MLTSTLWQKKEIVLNKYSRSRFHPKIMILGRTHFKPVRHIRSTWLIISQPRPLHSHIECPLMAGFPEPKPPKISAIRLQASCTSQLGATCSARACDFWGPESTNLCVGCGPEWRSNVGINVSLACDNPFWGRWDIENDKKHRGNLCKCWTFHLHTIWIKIWWFPKIGVPPNHPF